MSSMITSYSTQSHGGYRQPDYCDPKPKIVEKIPKICDSNSDQKISYRPKESCKITASESCKITNSMISSYSCQNLNI